MAGCLYRGFMDEEITIVEIKIGASDFAVLLDTFLNVV